MTASLDSPTETIMITVGLIGSCHRWSLPKKRAATRGPKNAPSGLCFCGLRRADMMANANKVRHLQIINGELGLSVPIVTTPDLLLTENDND